MRGLLVKSFVGVLLASFPAALYLLFVADVKTDSVPTSVSDITRTIEKRQQDLAVLDNKILEARGQMMKFEDMRSVLLKDLTVLKEKISDVITRSKNDEAKIHGTP